MLAVVIASIAGTGLQGSAPVERASLGMNLALGRVAGADCSDDRKGLRYYRHWRGVWQHRMGAGVVSQGASSPRTCPQIHRLAEIARWNAYKARWYYERWHARLQRQLANPTQAILYVFGAYGQEALRVASCESGRGIHAVNGQYVNLFQMGYWERRTYGWHVAGSPAIVAARAAWRYFVASGRDWSPWSCRP